jgi:hypothetical protein
MTAQCGARGMAAYAFNCIASSVARDAMQKQHSTTLSQLISGAKLENNHSTLM